MRSMTLNYAYRSCREWSTFTRGGQKRSSKIAAYLERKLLVPRILIRLFLEQDDGSVLIELGSFRRGLVLVCREGID